LVIDVEQRLKAPHRRQHGQSRLDVDSHIAGVHRKLNGLRRWQARAKLAVHQQRPHVAEFHLLGDQILDVHPAISQRTPVSVRLGDLRRERRHTGEAGDEVVGNAVWESGSVGLGRCRHGGTGGDGHGASPVFGGHTPR
jgi:hypothetical protein